MASAPTSEEVSRGGSSGGAHLGQSQDREGGMRGMRGQPGTACSYTRSQPGNRRVPEVWDPLVWLWGSPKLSPFWVAPHRGWMQLGCGVDPAPGAPKPLLGGCSGLWALKRGLGELVGPDGSSVQGKRPPLEQRAQGRGAPTCSHPRAGAATLPGAVAGEFQGILREPQDGSRGHSHHAWGHCTALPIP